VEAVRLSSTDCRLLAARYVEHGNSHRRMSASLREAGATPAVERLIVLRQLEHKFDVDLGLLCHWYERRDGNGTHPVERAIITYLTTAHRIDDVTELWIRLDRVRELRDLLEESRLVSEPES
jgi:hypothetical protein